MMPDRTESLKDLIDHEHRLVHLGWSTDDRHKLKEVRKELGRYMWALSDGGRQ